MKFHLDRFIEIVDRIGLPVLSVVPGGDKIAPLVPKILAGIKEAQAIRGASGEEKKKHVLAIVVTGADVANATGKVKISATELEAIASKGIDTVVEAVHVVEGAKATRPGEVSSTSTAAADTAGTVPAVDAGSAASSIGDGHASHGHGSADNLPPTK